MAGNDKVLDFEAERIVNYSVSAEKFDKLAKLAKQKQEALQKARDDASSDEFLARDADMEAGAALNQVNREVELQTKHIESLERQREELGRKIDAAQSSGDRDTVTKLDDEFGQMRVQIEKAQQQLAETKSLQDAAEAKADAAQRSLADAMDKAQEAEEALQKVDVARSQFEQAATKYAEAGRNRDLAEIAAGGDADATRRAVLAEADRVSGEYHKVATQQAEVFEKLQLAEANEKSLQGQIDIGKREQARLQDQVKAAEKAGRADEAASLQKELQWRTDRVNQLTDRMVMDGGNAEALREQNDALHKQAQELKKDSEDLRKLSNEKPEKIEDTFTKRQEDAEAEALTATPIKGDTNDTIATELEEDAAEADTQPDAEDEPTGTRAEPEAGSDPGASLDDLDTDGAASTETDTGAEPGASDPGASLDDLDTREPVAAASVSNGDATADAGPRIVDDEMLQSPAAAPESAHPTQEPAVHQAIEDAGSQGAEIEVQEPVFEDTPAEPVVAHEPEPEPEPEQDQEPETEPEFAE